MGIGCGFRRLLAAVSCVLIGSGTAAATAPTYVENFSTTDYRDPAQTTALWNTAAGELRLHPFQMSLLDAFDTGTAMDLAVAGQRIYVADYTNGLCVLDLSWSASLNQIGRYDTPGNPYGVFVAGDVAYVADYAAGLIVIDISNPSAPSLLGSYNTAGYAQGVVVAGNYAFVADGPAGVAVINVSNPASPTYAGGLDTPSTAVHLALSGNLLFVADGTSGVQVMDVTVPGSPSLVGSYNTPGTARGVAADGDWLYVADYNNGLVILDIANPAVPTLLGTLDTSGYANRVFVSGNMAYLADHNSGLLAIDVTDRAHPVLVEAFDTPGAAYSLVLADERAFVADGTSGVQIVDVQDLGTPLITGVGSSALSSAVGVAVHGDFAFVADGPGGMSVYDISDLSSPQFVANYPAVGGASAVVTDGNHAFLACGSDGLHVFDITIPASPVRVGGYDTPGSTLDVVVDGDYVYLADGLNGVGVLNISNPASPAYVGWYQTNGLASGLALAGDRLFVADSGNGICALDISNPASLTLVGTRAEAARRLAIHGDLLFVATDNNFLNIFDINDPANIYIWNPYYGENYTQIRDITIEGDYAFLSDASTGLHVLDISDPSRSLVPVGWCDLPHPGRVLIRGAHAFVPNRDLGLAVAEVFFRDFDLTRNRAQSLTLNPEGLEIVRGRLQSAQTDSLTWQLTADGGVHWVDLAPGETGIAFASPGSDLRWSAELFLDQPQVSPAVSRLQVDWFYAVPFIVAVTDIPNDQGRQVRVEWSRSGHDFLGDPSQIVEYAVYRKIADPAKATGPDLPAALSDVARESALAMAAAGWDFVASVPVRVQDSYAVVVPTLGDSTLTDGQFFSTFLVSALTATPGVFFDSPPDSGYSLDNLAPSVPGGFLVDYALAGNSLSWLEIPDLDFRCFRVYRGTTTDFVPGPDNLVHLTIGTGWVDPVADPWRYRYQLSAVDFAGNESPLALPAAVTGIDDGAAPTPFALSANAPNPFNPLTTIAFVLPRAERVRLGIFDLTGRVVRVLVDEVRPAGSHEVQWNGTDHRGQPMASGVYVCRMEAGPFRETRRMTLVK